MNTMNNNKLLDYTEKNGITYILAGDVYLPLITGNDHPKKPLGFWGRQRRAFLKEHDGGLYTELLLTGTLYDHLSEIDDAAQRRYDALMDAMQASLWHYRGIEGRGCPRMGEADECACSGCTRDCHKRVDLLLMRECIWICDRKLKRY